MRGNTWQVKELQRASPCNYHGTFSNYLVRGALGGRVEGKLSRLQRHKEKKEAAVKEQSVRRGVGGKRGFDRPNEGHFYQARSWQVHPPLKFCFKLQVQHERDTEKHTAHSQAETLLHRFQDDSMSSVSI